MKCVIRFSIAALSVALLSSARGAFVTPMMGGGQVGMSGAPMVHTDIGFDGTNLMATLDTSRGSPTLRPLTPPEEFDPAQPWSVLGGKAYNFQYAWNPTGFITLPTGSGIWIERIRHDDGLEAYKRAPATPSYGPVFVADGDRWQWSGAMTHNVYAVLNPTRPEYSATYRIYIGDAVSGSPIAGFGGATITWTWNAIVVPEPGSALLSVFVPLLWNRRR